MILNNVSDGFGPSHLFHILFTYPWRNISEFHKMLSFIFSNSNCNTDYENRRIRNFEFLFLVSFDILFSFLVFSGVCVCLFVQFFSIRSLPAGYYSFYAWQKNVINVRSLFVIKKARAILHTNYSVIFYTSTYKSYPLHIFSAWNRLLVLKL